MGWVQEFDAPLRGAPAIAGDGTLLVTSGAVLHHLGADGQRMGTFPMGGDGAGLALLANGTVMVPALGERLLLGPAMSQALRQVALPARASSEPVSDGASVYFGFADGSWRSVDGEGRVRWASIAFGKPCTAPAAITGDTLVAACGEQVRALNTADGRHRWVLELGDDLIGGPTAHNGLVYLATADRRVACYSARDGHEQWQVTLPAVAVAAPTVSPRRGAVVVALADHSLYTVDADSIKRLYTAEAPIHGASLLSANGTLLVTAGAVLRGVQANGQERWRLHLPVREAAVGAVAPEGWVLVTGERSLMRVNPE
jgi:outer membrane protein assembly factor BamB